MSIYNRRSVSSSAEKKSSSTGIKIESERSDDYPILAAAIDRYIYSAMGACASCNAATMIATEGTTKVVFPDGGLREYGRPVTPAWVLGKDAACYFVCDVDEMEFEEFVSAVGANRELRLGQLYFVLPRSMLSHPLRAEELAALAVKASAALVGSSTGGCGRGAVVPLVFPEEAEAEAVGKKMVEEKKKQQRSTAGRGRKFAPELTAIPE
ncbi:hypothetical protein Cni_G08320 [Canna indica]|uniref:Uncharacterized protein n=1 Tax=Canna indica TaxID=4628 RepID=A0AAQ3Q6N2_9LILI|nr:hypothetical protein Cni_G08320 [Canna indica]